MIMIPSVVKKEQLERVQNVENQRYLTVMKECKHSDSLSIHKCLGVKWCPCDAHSWLRPGALQCNDNIIVQRK